MIQNFPCKTFKSLKRKSLIKYNFERDNLFNKKMFREQLMDLRAQRALTHSAGRICSTKVLKCYKIAINFKLSLSLNSVILVIFSPLNPNTEMVSKCYKSNAYFFFVVLNSTCCLWLYWEKKTNVYVGTCAARKECESFEMASFWRVANHFWHIEFKHHSLRKSLFVNFFKWKRNEHSETETATW